MCLGDLQTCAQSIATNPEGDGGQGQGEDQAGHGVSFDLESV